MARFDVFRNQEGDGFLIDCQAELLSDLNTRVVIPLLPAATAPKAAGRLNPKVDIEGEAFVVVTQFLSAMEVRELGPKAGSIAQYEREIVNALDLLLTGV